MSISRRKREGNSMVSQDTTPAEVNSALDILQEQFMERMHELHSALDSDLLACDAKWTLFVAAALSYRYDALLRPFPTRFASEQSGCNIDALVSVINDMPKLSVVLSCIAEQSYEGCDVEVLELLHWVLVDNRIPTLRPLDDDECEQLLHAVGEKSNLEWPTHVFEVCQATSCHSNTFLAPSNYGQTDVAYYGNKLDSFFSIINHGFLQNQCAANDYAGTPLVLKRHLADSLSQSPIGAGWGASSCGSMIACVAVCEYQNLAAGTECNEGSQVDINGGGSGDAGRADGDEANVVVKNSDSVRVRYLLFYGNRFAEDVVPESDMLGWINRHKYSLSLAAYMLMLASIGVANSGSGQYIRQFLSKKAAFVLDFCKRIFVNE